MTCVTSELPHGAELYLHDSSVQALGQDNALRLLQAGMVQAVGEALGVEGCVPGRMQGCQQRLRIHMPLEQLLHNCGPVWWSCRLMSFAWALQMPFVACQCPGSSRNCCCCCQTCAWHKDNGGGHPLCCCKVQKDESA